MTRAAPRDELISSGVSGFRHTRRMFDNFELVNFLTNSEQDRGVLFGALLAGKRSGDKSPGRSLVFEL